MYNDRSICHNIFLLWAFSTALTAQSDSCLVRQIPVSVTDQKGRFVSDLTASDFRAQIGGSRTNVTAVTRGFTRRVILLLDVSSSMKTSPLDWQSILSFTRNVAIATPAKISIAFLTFDDDTQVVSGFDRPRAELLQKVSELATVALKKNSKANTALLDAIKTSTALLEPIQSGDAIFVVTDGQENSSMEKEPQLQRYLLSAGVRVFGVIGVDTLRARVLGLGPSPLGADPTPNVFDTTGGLSVRLSWEVAGGRNTFHPELSRDALAMLLQEMTTWYQVQITLGQPIHKYFPLDIEARKSGGSLLLRFPRKVAPCQ